MKLPDILKEIGEMADQSGIKIFLVGGFVRDALLGIKDTDIDVVIEGDAINFAKILADKFNVGNRHACSLRAQHDGFGTATIEKAGFRIDLATARKERYKKPAALPEVKPATIKEDLFRRDFTINAMAISLNKDNFGGLIDFYGGREDLKNKIIRVLHDKSFIDDPTRIYRAVRFQQRLKFKIEPHTQKLMDDAIRLGMLERLKPQRVKKELDKIKEDRIDISWLEKTGLQAR